MNTINPTHNAMAIEMAVQQIASYDAEIQRLDEQIKQMEARKDALRIMRQTLAPLATSQAAENRDIASDLQLPNSQNHTGNGHLHADASGISSDGVSRPSGTGFSTAVREVLQQFPKGLKAQEVAEQMQKSGRSAIYTGSTPIVIRVGNELYRMMKSGKLQKRNGRYMFPTFGNSQ